jgi:hypothetical protein
MRFVAAAVALFAFAGCAADPIASHPANPEIQREITEIIKRVRTETGASLYDDLKRLVAYDIFAVAQVSELARDPNARVRSNAMWVLAQINDPEHPTVMKKIDGALKDGLDDKEPTVRYEAASGLAARGDWEVLPVLIDGLQSNDSGVRFRCHAQLVATTSRDFGFSVDGPVDQRAQAIDRWRIWYSDWLKTRS